MDPDALARNLNALSAATSSIMDVIVELGDEIPHGTPLGNATLKFMDVVIDMDNKIDQTRDALAFLGQEFVKNRRGGNLAREERAELMQARRDRRAWEEDRAAMERSLAELTQRERNLQDLNNMLLERMRRPTSAPSSGFCSASHSPQSIDEEDPAPSRQPAAPAAAVPPKKEEEAKAVAAALSHVPLPPKPERKQPLYYTPEFDSATFKDSLHMYGHKEGAARPKLPVLNLDDTIMLSESPEAANEGPLCSTFRDERSVYHTPASCPQKMRRRSSSLGDKMKKIFTPKRTVKNPILETTED